MMRPLAVAALTAEADVARYRADPGALPSLPLGRFSDAGARALLLRRGLLKLPRPALRPLAALLARLSPRFASEVIYWRAARDLLTRAEWQSLTHAPVILMYHAVTTPGETPSRYVVSWTCFQRHMMWLRSRGYRLLTLHELTQARDTLCLPPPRAVVVTFDDGYRDNIDTLTRARVPATIFVVTGYIGRANHWDADGLLRGRPLMTWDEARTLQAQGIEIASHTRTHPPLPEVSPERLQDELRGSLTDLQMELGPGPRTFAYPHGRFDEAVQTAVERSGFAAACCSRGGQNDPFIPRTALRRVEIKGTDSFADFVLMTWLGRRITPRQFLRGLIFG